MNDAEPTAIVGLLDSQVGGKDKSEARVWRNWGRIMNSDTRITVITIGCRGCCWN